MTSLLPLRLVPCLLLLLAGGRAEEATPPRAPAAGLAENITTGKTAVDPEAKGLLHLGASLTDRADYVAAEIAFRQILDHGSPEAPERNQALLGLARMYRKQGVTIKAAAI